MTMSWEIYIVILILSSSTYGILYHYVDDTINPFLFGFVFTGLASVLHLVTFSVYLIFNDFPEVSSLGVLYGVMAGLSGVLVDVGVLMMFRKRAPVSIGLPFVRVWSIIMAAILGFIIFHETLEFKDIIGIILSCMGVWFLVSKSPDDHQPNREI